MTQQKVRINCRKNEFRKLRSFTSALLLTTLLVPSIGIGAGLGFRDNSRASDHVQGQLHEAAVSLIKTAASLATERGLVYLAMFNKEPISEDSIKLVQSNRSDAETNYRSAIGFFDEKYKAELAHPRYDNAQLLDELNALRPSIDQQLAVSMSERDLDLADKWFDEATNAIESVDRLSRFVNQQISKDDPTLRRILMLQRSALMMREQVGLERAILSSAAGGAKLRFSQLSILRDTPIVQSRFADVVDLTASDALNDTNVASALSKANIAVDSYRDARMEMVESDGNEYPMTAADWFQYATKTIDALNGLVIAIVDYAKNKVAKS